MDIHTAIHQRRTIHTWQALPMQEEALAQAIEAAHMAPCHRQTWPWRFNIAGPKTREAIFELAVQLKKGDAPEISKTLRNNLIRKIKNPAVLIVVSMIQTEDDFMNRENYAAVSCAIQNLSLSLHANGYGSKWSTGKITRHSKVYKMMQIDENSEEIVGFIWAGVPDRVPSPPDRPLVTHFLRKLD